MTRPVQRYMTGQEVAASRRQHSADRLEQMAAAARDAWEDHLTTHQPHRCGSCGAWVPPGEPCRTGCAPPG